VYFTGVVAGGPGAGDIDGPLIVSVAGATIADAGLGILLINPTEADGSGLSVSPLLVLEGQMFDGTDNAEVQFGLVVQPRSTGGGGGGNVSTTGILAIDQQQSLRVYYNTDDGGWTGALIITADGSIVPFTAAGTGSTGQPQITGYGTVRTQRLLLTSGALTASPSHQYLNVSVGGLTDLTSIELVEFDLAAATINYAAGGGTEATALGVSIRAPTIAAATDARTITDAATLYVAGAPAVGALVTITSAWSLWVDAGDARFDGVVTPYLAAVGAVSTDAAVSVLLLNPTAAAAGAQQYSPMLVLEGQGWKTDATAATQEVQFGLQVVPIQGAANPTGQLSIFSNINDGGFTEVVRFTSGATGQALGLAGAIGTPTWAFSTDPDTGTYSGGANIFGIAAGGAARLLIANAAPAVRIAVAASGTSPAIALNGDQDTGVLWPAAEQVGFMTAGTERLRVDNTAVATQTSLLVYDVDNATLERVTVGIADSGGAGFKVLRIAN